MIKKVITTAILIGGVTLGGVAFADNQDSEKLEVEPNLTEIEVTDEENEYVVSPESDLYETVRLIEESELDLTEEAVEKALLQDEYADKRISEAEEMLENGNEAVAEELLEEAKKHIEETEKLIEEAEETGEDLSEVEDVMNESAAKRSQNLLALLEREHLPEQAKAGIRKALANQERAMQRSAHARGKHKTSNAVETEEIKEVIKDVIEEASEEEIIIEAAATSENFDQANNERDKHVTKANEKAEKALEKVEQRIQKAEEKAAKAQGKAQERAEGNSPKQKEKTETNAGANKNQNNRNNQ